MIEDIEKIIEDLLELRHKCFPSHHKCKEEIFNIERVFSTAYPNKKQWRFVCSHAVPFRTRMSAMPEPMDSFAEAQIYLAKFIAEVIEQDCQTFLSTPHEEAQLIPGGMQHWHMILNELVVLQRLLLADT